MKTISPVSALPQITDALTIDGYTQGDGTADDATSNTLSIGNDAHLLIELNGTNAGLSSGLKITGANITVRGLVINRFGEYGLLIDGPGTTIEGNFIGTGVSGATDLGNSQSGVAIFDHSNTIGGTTPGARNVISGNTLSGVSFNCNCSTDNRVQGNYIGTDKNGTAPLGNSSDGVTMFVGAHTNTIGGTTDGARNVISGNAGRGVSAGFGGNNQVQGNYIGTDASGATDLGNSSDGVVTSSGAGDTIGGTTDGARNVISGNDGSGVAIRGTGNQLLGNYIGTDKNGTASLGNSSNGVLIDGGLGNWIGGTTDGARNVISGNGSAFGGSGVFIQGVGGNQVRGNYIGTDKNGTASLGNRFRGVVILDAANNTIGGTEAGAGNVISGNTLSGVFIKGTTDPGNRVRGNYIGTDAFGTAPLGNSAEGVNIDSGSGDTIGDTASGGGNVISSNHGDGIFISGSGSQVQGNYIGTDKNGTRPAGAPALGNSGSGVTIGSQGANNTVGGSASGARNVISGNNGSGVSINGNSNQVRGNYVGTDVSGTASLGNSFDGVAVSGTNNAILSNAIFSNGQLGIDLFPDGVNANDPGDSDFGANSLQNFPVITSADVNEDGSTTIGGTLDSTPSTTFTVQFFASPSADPSSHGEGRTFLGQKTDVTTGDGGNASFTFTTQENVSGQYVAATATSPTNDTSEFSEVEQVPEANAPPVNSVPGAQSTNEDSALVFSGSGGNQISVSDPDAATNPVKVRLQADHGTLTLDGTAGLSFGPGDSGTNDADMTFSGPLADVNGALDGMSFDPYANYDGPATLTITTDDQGATGAGGAKTDADTVNITVNAVNDFPVASNDSYRIKEDKTLKVASPGVLSNDTDPDGDALTTRLVSGPGKGKLTLNGDGSLVYKPGRDFHGTVSFTYGASDGTADSNAARVSIKVLAVPG